MMTCNTLMQVKDYYNKWRETNATKTQLNKLLNTLNILLKDNWLPADEGIHDLTVIQKEIEILSFNQIQYKEIFKLYNIRQNSQLYINKTKFELALEEEIKLNPKQYKRLIETGINKEEIFVIFYLSLIAILKKEYEDKSDKNNDFKESQLIFKIVDFFKSFLKNKLTIKIDNQKKHYTLDHSKSIKNDSWLYDISKMLIKLGEDSHFLTPSRTEVVRPKRIYYRNVHNEILENLIQHSVLNNIRLPMLTKPISYDENGIGGYLSSKDEINKENKEVNLLLTESGTVLHIDKVHLEQMNYLMSIPLKISKEYVERIMDLDEKEIKENLNIDLTTITQEKLTNKFDTKLYETLNFLFVLFLAASINELTIYLNWAFDGRGRFYNTNTPLSFQSNALIRNLFTLKTTEESENMNKPELSDIKKNSLNFFEKINYEIHRGNALIGIDATNSAYQIIGGLLRDEKIMELTNIIGTEKKDLYTDILNTFKEKLDWDQLETFYKTYKEGIKTTLYYDLVKPDWNKFKIIIESIDRKVLKKPIMTLAYNQTIISAAEELQIALLGDVNTKLNKIFNYIIKTLHAIIYEKFPNFKTFQVSMMKFVKERFKSKPEEVIKITAANHTFSQKYEAYKAKATSIYSKLTKKRFKIYEWTSTKNVNMKKNSIAFLPNFVHFLDSCIAIDVVRKCNENNIEILTVHDCFYTKPKHHERVKQFYRESYIEIVLEEPLIENLYKNNDIKLNEDLRKIIAKNDELKKKCTNPNILW